MMRTIFIIHLLIISLGIFSQTTGYVLKNADGTTDMPDSAITIAKVKGLNQWLAQNLKTVNSNPVFGNGNISVSATTSWGGITGTLSNQSDLQTAFNTKVSVTDSGRAASNYATGGSLNKIKDSTIAAINALYGSDYRAANFIAGTNYLAPNGNGSSLTGLTATQVGLGNVNNTSDAAKPVSTATQTALNLKQDALVSGTNIKTVNGNTLLGSGDVVVGGGATSSTSGVLATATASGTQTITHNLGRTPTIIRINSISNFTSSTSATPVPFSMGIWNSSGNRCVYMVINGTTSQVSQTSTVFSVIMVTSAGNQITGVIQNVTNTGFDIVWSETGTHTAGNFMWECQ